MKLKYMLCIMLSLGLGACGTYKPTEVKYTDFNGEVKIGVNTKYTKYVCESYSLDGYPDIKIHNTYLVEGHGSIVTTQKIGHDCEYLKGE